MACTISFSNTKEDIWIIRNYIYEWFIDLVSQRYSDDKEMLNTLEMSVYTNGISIDSLIEENDALAKRLIESLRTVADEVSVGLHNVPVNDLRQLVDMQNKCKSAFAELATMLAKYK